MVLGHLLGSSVRETPPTDEERALLAVARASAGVGATAGVLGVLFLCLAVPFRGLSAQVVVGGGALVLGGVLWVLAQGLVARWVTDRRPRVLLAAIFSGAIGVLALWIGLGTVLGFSWAVLGLTVVVVGVEWALVAQVDRGRSAPANRPAPDAPVLAADERTALRWLGQAGAGLGLALGVAAAVSCVRYAVNWDQDWNLFGAYLAALVVAGAALWTLPQLALARADGRSSPTPGVLVWAAAWGGLLAVAPWWTWSAPLVGVPIAVLALLEVVVGAMALWRRLG